MIGSYQGAQDIVMMKSFSPILIISNLHSSGKN